MLYGAVKSVVGGVSAYVRAQLGVQFQCECAGMVLQVCGSRPLEEKVGYSINLFSQ